MYQPKIMIFDSGIGGLTVLESINQLINKSQIFYIADTECFPYGALNEGELIERVIKILTPFIEEFSPDILVIACNTASTLVLPVLRDKFHLPIVGTVPAIKPAAQQTKTGLISVLATEGTIKRDYTRNLIKDYASACEVTVIGCKELAKIAEKKLYGLQYSETEIIKEINQAFINKDGLKTDQIVLGCTHYPILIDEITKLSPWPVNFINPAPAIAKRVEYFTDKMESNNNPINDNKENFNTAYFTKEITINKKLIENLRKFSINKIDSFQDIS